MKPFRYDDDTPTLTIDNIDWYLLESDLQLSMPSEEKIKQWTYSEPNLELSWAESQYASIFIRGKIKGANWVKSQCKIIDLKEELVKFRDHYKKSIKPLIICTDEQIDEYLKQQ